MPFRAGAFRFQFAAHEDVRAAHDPDDGAARPVLGRQRAAELTDAADLRRSLFP